MVSEEEKVYSLILITTIEYVLYSFKVSIGNWIINNKSVDLDTRLSNYMFWSVTSNNSWQEYKKNWRLNIEKKQILLNISNKLINSCSIDKLMVGPWYQ